MNPSHLPDPTAEIAVARVAKSAPTHIVEVVKLLKQILSLGGLEMQGTILIRDRRTSKVWKVR